MDLTEIFLSSYNYSGLTPRFKWELFINIDFVAEMIKSFPKPMFRDGTPCSRERKCSKFELQSMALQSQLPVTNKTMLTTLEGLEMFPAGSREPRLNVIACLDKERGKELHSVCRQCYPGG